MEKNIISPKDLISEEIIGLNRYKNKIIKLFSEIEKNKIMATNVIGLLLYGPPGTGKTMLGKWIALKMKATFLNIQLSDINSKWYGESEKIIRSLFNVAKKHAPTVIFIDEIDAIFSTRDKLFETDMDRKLKSEFLTQINGITSQSQKPIILVGTTNKPFDLDDAFLRRFQKKMYIGLPLKKERIEILKYYLQSIENNIFDSDQNIDIIKEKTEGYSSSDLANVCKEIMCDLNEEEESLSEEDDDDLLVPQKKKEKDHDKQEKKILNLDYLLRMLELNKKTVHPSSLNVYKEFILKYGGKN
ncbi:MAG: ATP-binding protein [Tissierellia bacterium]|nr:ATP-binding protein [Tissierellia bacterium]